MSVGVGLCFLVKSVTTVKEDFEPSVDMRYGDSQNTHHF